MRVVWLAPLVFACNGSGETDDDGSNIEDLDCPAAETFTIGAAKTTPGGVTVTLTAADPIPPYRGTNTWTFSLSDAGGAVAGAAPALTPWMPLHGHGLVPPSYTGTEGDPGTYPVAPFDLSMSGQWEFTVDAGGGDSVMYTFCVQG
jgi:hypothetical protein